MHSNKTTRPASSRMKSGRIKTCEINGQAILAQFLVAVAMGTPTVAAAGPEHNHDQPGAITAAGHELPRFTAASELFELVGIVDGKMVTLYLDRFEDNAPVDNARIELEIGDHKVIARPRVANPSAGVRAVGEYEATLTQALKHGATPITASVVAGAQSDLLAAEVTLVEPTPAAAVPRTFAQPPMLIALAGGSLALVVLAWWGMRLRRNSAGELA